MEGLPTILSQVTRDNLHLYLARTYRNSRIYKRPVRTALESVIEVDRPSRFLSDPVTKLEDFFSRVPSASSSFVILPVVCQLWSINCNSSFSRVPCATQTRARAITPQSVFVSIWGLIEIRRGRTNGPKSDSTAGVHFQFESVLRLHNTINARMSIIGRLSKSQTSRENAHPRHETSPNDHYSP